MDPSLIKKISARQYENKVALDGSLASSEILILRNFNYDSVPLGKFFNIDSICLSWRSSEFFLFDNHDNNIFYFKRHNGEIVKPLSFFTDGGSIPRQFWFIKGLSPWSYGPAFLVHDWEFELHHCERSDKSFDEVRDTMIEAIKTLMEEGICEKSPFMLSVIYAGINSVVARRIWNRTPPACTLP